MGRRRLFASAAYQLLRDGAAFYPVEASRSRQIFIIYRTSSKCLFKRLLQPSKV